MPQTGLYDNQQGIITFLEAQGYDLVYYSCADLDGDATATLLTQTREERLAIPVMHPGRADVIGAGALVLRTVMERAGADSLITSEHDILDGIALSLR